MPCPLIDMAHACQHTVCHHCRDGEVKSFFEVMVRAREKEEILVGLKLKGQKSPVLNPKGKAEQALSLKTVSSFVVILTGVDPDKPSRHASWVGRSLPPRQAPPEMYPA